MSYGAAANGPAAYPFAHPGGRGCVGNDLPPAAPPPAAPARAPIPTVARIAPGFELLWMPGPAASSATFRPAGDPTPAPAAYYPGTPIIVQTVRPENTADQVLRVGWSVAAVISTVLCLVHGYRRNKGSVPWALGWGVFGGAAPVLAPTLAVLQGFGEPTD